MARGHPDWGVLTTSIGAYESDLTELAARLGSPYVFTRRGRVVFFDTFKGGIYHWIPTLSGTGSTARALTTTGFLNAGSLALTSGTPVNTAYAQLAKRCPHLATSKWGIEIVFWLTDTNDVLEVALDRYDGATLHKFSARVNLNNDQLEVLNSGATYTNVHTLPNLALTSESWNLLKLVVDMEDDTYSSLRLNDTLVSSGFPAIDTDANSSNPGLIEVRLKKSNPTSGAKIGYVANVVVTMDEP